MYFMLIYFKIFAFSFTCRLANILNSLSKEFPAMRDTEGFLSISGIIMKYLRTQLRAMQDSKQQIQIVKLLPDIDALIDVLNSTVSSTALSYLLEATIHPVQVTIRLPNTIETSQLTLFRCAYITFYFTFRLVLLRLGLLIFSFIYV